MTDSLGIITVHVYSTYVEQDLYNSIMLYIWYTEYILEKKVYNSFTVYILHVQRKGGPCF